MGQSPDPDLSRKLLSAYRDLKQTPPAGVLDVVPAYTEIAVHFDPLTTDALNLRDQVEERLRTAAPVEMEDRKTRTHHLPVVYDGLDLEHIAAHSGLTVGEVIQRHASPSYIVAMIGFMPHFPYCLGLDASLMMPRRTSPRTMVPAGSVALAGMQTGVYPQESPGGWNLLGRTNPNHLLEIRPGDHIRFESVEKMP